LPEGVTSAIPCIIVNFDEGSAEAIIARLSKARNNKKIFRIRGEIYVLTWCKWKLIPYAGFSGSRGWYFTCVFWYNVYPSINELLR
jgi:hypothetical protein